MKIAICDDNALDLEKALALARQYDPKGEITVFSAARDLYASRERFDAVLLDIEMEAPNGIEVAMRMAQQAYHPIILFTTNSPAYAIRGYGLALRYLLKPLTLDAVTEALDAAGQQLRRNRLTITAEDTVHSLHVQDVLFLEVQGHYITLHTTTGPLRFRGTLREISSQLPDRWFCAPHQSYVVNLLHVRSASQTEVLLQNDLHLPISRRRQKEFLQAFYAFMGVDAW